MSIQRTDVQALMGRDPGTPAISDELLDRLVSVLNAHRGPTAGSQVAGMLATDQPGERRKPGEPAVRSA